MDIKLNRTLVIELDPRALARLEQAAESNHLTSVRWCGCASLADEELLRQLVRIGSNLNQQTRVFHQMIHRDLPPNTAALIEAVAATQSLLLQVSRRIEEHSR